MAGSFCMNIQNPVQAGRNRKSSAWQAYLECTRWSRLCASGRWSLRISRVWDMSGRIPAGWPILLKWQSASKENVKVDTGMYTWLMAELALHRRIHRNWSLQFWMEFGESFEFEANSVPWQSSHRAPHPMTPQMNKPKVSWTRLSVTMWTQWQACHWIQRKFWKPGKEEMKWVEKQQLWDVVPTTMCWEETNRPPITLKWVDRNKGDDSHPNYRSRLVVREVKKASKSLAEFESFSAMPPLESLKVLCALMVSKRTSKRNRPYKMMLIDISRAHFYGESKRRVFCTTRGSLRTPQTLNVRDAGCCQHLAIYIRAVADGEQLQTVQSMAGTVHPWWNGLAFHRSWWWLHLPWWRWSFEVSRRMLKEEVWISCGWLDWSRRRRWYVNVRTQ